MRTELVFRILLHHLQNRTFLSLLVIQWMKAWPVPACPIHVWSQLLASPLPNFKSLSTSCCLQLPFFWIYCSLFQNSTPSSCVWRHLFNLQLLVYIFPSLRSISGLPQAQLCCWGLAFFSPHSPVSILCSSKVLSSFPEHSMFFFFMLHAFAFSTHVPFPKIQIPLVFTWLTPYYLLSSAQDPSVPESLPWTTSLG